MVFVRWFALGFAGVVIPFFLFYARAEEQIVLPRPHLFEHKARVLFFGDMLFDRQIRLIAEQKGEDYIFSCIDDLLKSPDLVVANLEGPITEYASRSMGSMPGSSDNFVFTFPTTTAELLARHGVAVVNIGNNHIGNMGWEGIAQTHHYLEEAEVRYFGGLEGKEYVHRAEVGGVPVSFVSYNEFGGSSPREVAYTIEREHAQGRVVVVYTHWGDEYIDSSARLRPIAELFAKNGAALIVGSHPHVVLGSEYIGGTLVYYSLGNFIFDQYFSEAVRTGLALEVVLSQDGVIDTVEYPLSIDRDGTTCLKN